MDKITLGNIPEIMITITALFMADVAIGNIIIKKKKKIGIHEFPSMLLSVYLVIAFMILQGVAFHNEFFKKEKGSEKQ